MSLATVRNILLGIYVILILGISAVAKAEIRILPWTPAEQNAKKYEGYVAQSVDGKYYLIIDEENEFYFELKGNIDFAKYVGWLVKVLGFEANQHKVGPVHSLQYIDLVDEGNEPVVAPILKVLSINGIALRE
jgi:hypothetical protein